jgi:hypothetical protein
MGQKVKQQAASMYGSCRRLKRPKGQIYRQLTAMSAVLCVKRIRVLQNRLGKP